MAQVNLDKANVIGVYNASAPATIDEIYGSNFKADSDVRKPIQGITVNPVAAPNANTVQTNGVVNVDFNLTPANSVPDRITSIIFSVTITNGHATNTITITPLNVINAIRFYANNVELVSPKSARWVLYDYLLGDSAVLSKKLITSGIDSNLASTAVLAANGGAGTFYILIESPFAEGGIPTFVDTVPLKMRVEMIGGAVLKQAGTAAVTDLTNSNVKTFVQGVNYTSDIRTNLITALKAGGVYTYKYMDKREITIASQNCTGGTAYTNAMNLVGKLDDAYVVGVSAGAKNGDANLISLPLTSLDITNTGNTSISGAPVLNRDLVKGPFSVNITKENFAPGLVINRVFYDKKKTDPSKPLDENIIRYTNIIASDKVAFTPKGSTADLVLYVLASCYAGCAINFTASNTAVTVFKSA